jgi:hypothetical protein
MDRTREHHHPTKKPTAKRNQKENKHKTQTTTQPTQNAGENKLTLVTADLESMVAKQQQPRKQISNTRISQRPDNEKPPTTTRKRTNQPNPSPPKAPTTRRKGHNSSDNLEEGGFRLKGEQNHTEGRSWRGGGPTTPPSGHESFKEQLSTPTTLRTGTLRTRPKVTHRNYDGDGDDRARPGERRWEKGATVVRRTTLNAPPPQIYITVGSDLDFGRSNGGRKAVLLEVKR